MTTFTPVQKGEKIKISAEEWNGVRKAVFDPDIQSNAPNNSRLSYRYVKVFNDQPEDVPAYGVLSVTGSLHDDDDDEIENDVNEQAARGMSSWVEVTGGVPTGDENEILAILQRPTESAWIQPAICFGATLAWVYINSIEHRYAKAIPDNVQMLESADSGSVRLMHTAQAEGLKLLPVLLGFNAGTAESEPIINAKELFPVVIYNLSQSSPTSPMSQTFLICPGGKGQTGSTKTVHVLDVENKKISTTKFGALPIAMNNFDAVIADNGYGTPLLVCTPGEVDDGSRYAVQRYDFIGEEWSKSDTNQSLVGCPAYVKDGKVIVAGGQSAYYVSEPVKTAGSTSVQFYGHAVTPFWEIDPASGALKTRVPQRIIVSGTSASPESPTVNQQKRFLKQNFSGIHYEHVENGKPVEFVAVGGTELLGYQGNAVVSYAMDSLGALLTCEHNTVGVYDNCEVFPDTPMAFGECDCVHITRRRSGNMMIDCNLLVCFGGRYRVEIDIPAMDKNGNVLKDEIGNNIVLYKTGEYKPHTTPFYLDLNDKAKGWRNDLFPEIPTPRWNAALTEPVATVELVLDENGKPETDGDGFAKTQTMLRVFLIGGRIDNRTTERVDVKDENGNITKNYHKPVTQKGLTAKIEAFNLTTNQWETNFPGLDGK
ncbi:MAG: hypothetical protein LBF88_13020 [Planctomycetaceae bacterium]|jgi:hypothetical protein|nr:hypothetical protein [Planctomycetaceae bacterium]